MVPLFQKVRKFFENVSSVCLLIEFAKIGAWVWRGKRGGVNIKIETNGPMIQVVKKGQRKKVPVTNSMGDVEVIRYQGGINVG